VSKPDKALIKPLLISLLAGLAMAAVWFTLAIRMQDALTWFALIAALDIALLERWTRTQGRSSAAWIAPAVTVMCCIASLWLITSASVVQASGFPFASTLQQMGYQLFQALLSIRLVTTDWLYLACAPILAYVLANTGVNARHQSP